MASYMGQYTFKYTPPSDLKKTVLERANKGDDGKLYFDIPYVKVNIGTKRALVPMLFARFV